GMSVRIASSKVDALRAIAGVTAVHPTHLVRPSLTVSVPYIGANAAWGDLGITGKGVKIGVIDTGIDYYHANFGGSGNPADFSHADGTTLADGGFPTAKVAGGFDLVGDGYDANSADPAVNTPHPDPDPLDCNGHGSHVAGTIGGVGVLSTGATFHGPYDSATPLQSFTIGPGVAPGADLYSIRVFGCTGSTDMTVEAIDWAV